MARLRLGRSGLVQIDRLFDASESRYEEACSKEANYHPSRIVEKMLSQQQEERERIDQEKLKVFSYSQTNRDALYKK